MSSDTIICIDRSLEIPYPEWVSKIIHPELEKTGLDAYDLSTAVSLWFYKKQKKSRISGMTVYNYLKERNMLKSCLGLQDALAVRTKGGAVFQEVFDNKEVYFFKSVVESCDDEGLHVPCLVMVCGRVALRWSWLDFNWSIKKSHSYFQVANGV
ncbi:MAG: hypothetical protein U5L76_05275 [Patescibacteria group bacterium]|nr:hypothetical protein [Patescibacteria group bacterium]